MSRTSFLVSLRQASRISCVCPNCQKEFRLSGAELFDATEALPEVALAYIRQKKDSLKERRNDLLRLRERASGAAAITSEAVNIGKTVEHIAPCLPGFPSPSGDYRRLFQPIDYIAFRNLTARGRIDAVQFVDVKSGNSKLTNIQKAIRDAVNQGKVSLRIVSTAKRK